MKIIKGHSPSNGNNIVNNSQSITQQNSSKDLINIRNSPNNSMTKTEYRGYKKVLKTKSIERPNNHTLKYNYSEMYRPVKTEYFPDETNEANKPNQPNDNDNETNKSNIIFNNKRIDVYRIPYDKKNNLKIKRNNTGFLNCINKLDTINDNNIPNNRLSVKDNKKIIKISPPSKRREKKDDEI